MLTFGHFLAVGAGAAVGGASRWLLSLWLNPQHVGLPWGTLAANLIGGYLIGLILGALSLYPEVPPWLRLMLITGLLGGFTTFSSFSAETFSLFERGQYATALTYMGVSVLGSLALTALGFATIQLARSPV